MQYRLLTVELTHRPTGWIVPIGRLVVLVPATLGTVLVLSIARHKNFGVRFSAGIVARCAVLVKWICVDLCCEGVHRGILPGSSG